MQCLLSLRTYGDGGNRGAGVVGHSECSKTTFTGVVSKFIAVLHGNVRNPFFLFTARKRRFTPSLVVADPLRDRADVLAQSVLFMRQLMQA